MLRPFLGEGLLGTALARLYCLRRLGNVTSSSRGSRASLGTHLALALRFVVQSLAVVNQFAREKLELAPLILLGPTLLRRSQYLRLHVNYFLRINDVHEVVLVVLLERLLLLRRARAPLHHIHILKHNLVDLAGRPRARPHLLLGRLALLGAL